MEDQRNTDETHSLQTYHGAEYNDDQVIDTLSVEDCLAHARKQRKKVYGDELLHQPKAFMMKCESAYFCLHCGFFVSLNRKVRKHKKLCSTLCIAAIPLLLIGNILVCIHTVHRYSTGNKKFHRHSGKNEVVCPSIGFGSKRTRDVIRSQESIQHLIKVIQLAKRCRNCGTEIEVGPVNAGGINTFERSSADTKAYLNTRNLEHKLAHNNRLPWNPKLYKKAKPTIPYQDQSRSFVIPKKGFYKVSVSIGFTIEGTATKNLTSNVFRQHNKTVSLLMKKTISVIGNVGIRRPIFISLKLNDIFRFDQGTELHVDVENSTISNILLYGICNSVDIYKVSNSSSHESN